MSRNQLFYNISKIYTLANGIRIKEALNNVEIVNNSYMYIEDGLIKEIGHSSDIHKFGDEIEKIDLNNMIITPGFIDAHTHLVFAGNRDYEYLERITGVTYLDGLKKGKGIHKSVEETRSASFEELVKKAYENSLSLISTGVTTIESKSGYGLDLDTEIKQLQVNKEVSNLLGIDIISTYLGAHALPKDKTKNEYIKFINDEVMPKVKELGLADFVDVFTEEGVFSIEETQEIFNRAQELGFKLKIHADEMTPLGGAKLAAQYQVTSADHLLCARHEDLLKMRDNGVVAVLLPMTSFNLKKQYADAAFMKENGLIMALASDFNPGSSPCSDFIMMMRIASRVYNLSPHEILTMVTINAAKAINKDTIIGSLEINKQADFVVFASDDFNSIIINMGNPNIKYVYKKGDLLWRDKNEWSY